jgi:hypothetical protein
MDLNKHKDLYEYFIYLSRDRLFTVSLRVRYIATSHRDLAQDFDSSIFGYKGDQPKPYIVYIVFVRLQLHFVIVC